MKLVAFAFGLLATGPAFAAGQVLDGSFEDPHLPTCCRMEFKAGATLGNWHVTGGKVVLTDTKWTLGGFTFNAKDGKQWLNLEGGRTPGRVEQQVKTTQGTYELSFSVGSVYDPGGKNGATSSVRLLINGDDFGTFTVTAKSGTQAQQWQKFSLRFSTGNQHTVIGFAGADPKSDADCGIDDVVFRRKF